MSVVFGGVLVVFGCVSMCQHVIVCVSVYCLRCWVASVLASMSWLLCAGDGLKKTTSVIRKKKKREGFFYH